METRVLIVSSIILIISVISAYAIDEVYNGDFKVMGRSIYTDSGVRLELSDNPLVVDEDGKTATIERLRHANSIRIERDDNGAVRKINIIANKPPV